MTDATKVKNTKPERRPRKREVGIVASDKMTKTRRVIVERLRPPSEIRQAAAPPHRLPRA